MNDNLKKFYVYVLHRPWNMVPCYVGKGKGSRVHDHEKQGSSHRNRHLANIFRKAGGSIPFSIVFETSDEAEALKKEMRLIAELGRSDLGSGPLCNLTDGEESNSGRIVSESARLKIALVNTGRKHTEEHKAKNRAAQLGNKYAEGTVHTNEYKEAARLRAKGNAYNAGNKWTKETYAKHKTVKSNLTYVENHSQKISRLWENEAYREQQMTSRKNSEAYQNRNKNPSPESILKRAETRKRNTLIKKGLAA